MRAPPQSMQLRPARRSAGGMTAHMLRLAMARPMRAAQAMLAMARIMPRAQPTVAVQPIPGPRRAHRKPTGRRARPPLAARPTGQAVSIALRWKAAQAIAQMARTSGARSQAAGPAQHPTAASSAGASPLPRRGSCPAGAVIQQRATGRLPMAEQRESAAPVAAYASARRPSWRRRPQSSSPPSSTALSSNSAAAAAAVSSAAAAVMASAAAAADSSGDSLAAAAAAAADPSWCPRRRPAAPPRPAADRPVPARAGYPHPPVAIRHRRAA